MPDDPEEREVTVPLRLYKVVTVFSTLLAMIGFVGGFVLLDTATNRGTRRLPEVDPLLAFAGVALIVAGAAVYIYGVRFRAPGMGKDNTEDAKPNDDG